jgi:hypothetical protein
MSGFALAGIVDGVVAAVDLVAAAVNDDEDSQ